MDSEELLTAEQAQEYLGVSRATLWTFVKRFNVPRYAKPLSGKRVFFKRADLDAARATTVRRGGDRPVKTAA